LREVLALSADRLRINPATLVLCDPSALPESPANSFSSDF
jgi:hypothetical protein